jgi:stearoyl-CoA desaturase (delta-9 desaturase)
MTHTYPIHVPRKKTPREMAREMIPFLAIHVASLGALWSGATPGAIWCAVVLYWLRMFAVTGGYHRYFSHRTFKTSRWFQFVLAFLAESSSQRGVLWWGSNHRHHHRFSDQPEDIHSPRQKGFWYSHVLWIFAEDGGTDLNKIKDLAKYPELRWLDKHWLVPPTVLGIITTLLFGWSGLFVGFCLSTVVLWHCTFTINSLSHVFGSRRYETTDDSRNNPLLAFITMGEGWHNNHHHYMLSCRQGFRWWEFDFTYYVLKGLSWVGLVWDIREPPAKILHPLDHHAESSALQG